MKTELFIVPIGKRYFLKDATGKLYGQKIYGYKSRQSASAAKSFLINAHEAMKASYKGRMWQEEKHFREI